MASRAKWVAIAKTASKNASIAIVKSLGWIAAAIFCIQKATARAYDCGANNAVSKISEGIVKDIDENGDNDTEEND